MDGVLVSWAVPKGVPTDLAAKRLAVHVEDHPLAYGSFEGEIPRGNYGAGTVRIFDRGRWQPLGRDWRQTFQRGKLKFTLHGERLHGTYLLARMEEPNWLLRLLAPETDDGESSPPVRETARFVAPQLARLVPAVPGGAGWLHELKFDGYRLIAVRRGGEVRLYTRNRLDWTERFPAIAARLADLPGGDFVLDGEAVVFDERGRSRFGELQAALRGDDEAISFVAFDLPHRDGVSLRDLPLSRRLEQLAEMISRDDETLRPSTTWPATEGAELFRQACRNGLEGIVSKPANSRYHEGERRDWVKSKCRSRQEFVICGYTEPSGSRSGFGALVLASSEAGELVPRGKVGTGFSEAERERLLHKFRPLRRREPLFPFPGKVHWIEPQLIAEVEYAEITRDGSIRQGSYLGLREDKSPGEVRLEGLRRTRRDPGKIVVAGIVVTHPERLVYPEDQITKLEVAEYYERVGELMLPYLAHRPLAVLRAPDGISGGVFFQKSFPQHLPRHVHRRALEDGSSVFEIRQLEGIVSLAQFGAIEFHPWGATLSRIERPDLLVWDLDPSPGLPLAELRGAALLLRDYLAGHGVSTVLKTSGGKGFHLVASVARRHDWTLMKAFAKAVAEAVAAMNPHRLTTTASKAKRSGKIFIDYLRNGRGATCIAPWSLRARPGAAVSRPVNWSEIATAKPDSFTIASPAEIPEDWLGLAPQTIRLSTLRELGVIG